MKQFKITPKHSAGIIPWLFDLIFIIPYLFLSILDFKMGILSLIILTLYGYTIFFSLLAGKAGRLISAPSFNLNLLRISIFFSAAVYLYGIISNQNEAIFIMSLTDIGAIAQENSISRYDGLLKVSWAYKAGVIIAFSAAVQGAFLFTVARSPMDYMLSLSILLIGLIDSIVMGSRSGLMQLTITFLSSLYIAKFRSSPHQFPSYFKILAILILGTLTIYVYFLFIQLLRGGGNTDNLKNVAGHVLTWFFGYLPAFSEWLDHTYKAFQYAFGSFTFAGIYDALGFGERAGGIYQPVQISEARVTNIFTAYRGLIEDFGLFGSIIFMAILGRALSICITARRNLYWMTFFLSLIIVTFIAWSFVISIWTYNSIILGQAIGVFTCFIFSKLKKSNNARPFA